RHERDVAGNQRQDARRDERQEARGERGEECNILVHDSAFDDLIRLTGIVDGSGRPSNFTGGRALNITSHFQRSDGFDSWSPCFAATGRANAIVASPSYRALPASTFASSARICALVVYSNVVPTAAPKLTKICQSSSPSPGAVNARAAACSWP